MVCSTCLFIIESLKVYSTVQTYGTVALPLWKSASFWPYLCPSGEVVGTIYLPTNKGDFTPGKGKKSVFGNKYLPFRVMALRKDIR